MSKHNKHKKNHPYTMLDFLREGTFFFLYGCVKYIPSPIGEPLRWMVLKIFMRKLRTMRIRDGATFWFPKRISIGKHVSINEWVFMDGYGGISIGDDCRIAHGCSFISEDHNFNLPDVPIRLQGKSVEKITVGRDCWFGAGVKVLKGVTIGDGCVVGAGSIVTKNIPPQSVAVGIPARVVKQRGA